MKTDPLIWLTGLLSVSCRRGEVGEVFEGGGEVVGGVAGVGEFRGGGAGVLGGVGVGAAAPSDPSPSRGRSSPV